MTLQWLCFCCNQHAFFFSKLDWRFCIVSIAKTDFYCSMIFFFFWVWILLHRILLSDYCSQLLLDMLDKLQKRACSTVGPRLTASLKPSSYLGNVASLSLSHSYYFMFIWIGWICSTSILSWDVHLFFLIVYLISLSPFLNVIRLLFVNHFFLCLARLCMRNAFLWVMI